MIVVLCYHFWWLGIAVITANFKDTALGNAENAIFLKQRQSSGILVDSVVIVN